MAATRKVRILKRQGDTQNGMILVPGAIVDMPVDAAERLIAKGLAEPAKAAKKSK